MEQSNVLLAFGLTLFAGLSTGIGSALALFAKRVDTRFLCISLGFSGGVMIYVSFVEIFPKAAEHLTDQLGTVWGTWVTVLSFFGGIALIGIIDKLVPSFENPHEMHQPEEIDHPEMVPDHEKLYRMGLMAALAIAIHNFPEGFATFASALKDISVGIPIAIAIAIHNIPEGVAVSVPLYYATGSRRKAFTWSFLSGLAEPLGAAIGYGILYSFMNDTVLGIAYASVAGIMVFISLDELLPSAERYGQHHTTIYGVLAGMAVMAVSLLLFL